MSHYIIITLVYIGTFLLWGTVPLCLFFPSEDWFYLLGVALLGSVLLGFLIKILFHHPFLRGTKRLGYYLWGAGYWGQSDCEGHIYGMNKLLFGYIVHWFLVMLLTMVWGDYLLESHIPNVKCIRCMMQLLFFYNLFMPLFGTLWRSCFEPNWVDKNVEESRLEKDQSFFIRIPPICYDIFFQWFWFYTATIMAMATCSVENFLFPIVWTAVSALIQMSTLLLLIT